MTSKIQNKTKIPVITSILGSLVPECSVSFKRESTFCCGLYKGSTVGFCSQPFHISYCEITFGCDAYSFFTNNKHLLLASDFTLAILLCSQVFSSNGLSGPQYPLYPYINVLRYNTRVERGRFFQQMFLSKLVDLQTMQSVLQYFFLFKLMH